MLLREDFGVWLTVSGVRFLLYGGSPEAAAWSVFKGCRGLIAPEVTAMTPGWMPGGSTSMLQVVGSTQSAVLYARVEWFQEVRRSFQTWSSGWLDFCFLRKKSSCTS